MEPFNDHTKEIISCAILFIHNLVQVCLNERTRRLHYKLIQIGLLAEREIPLPLKFEGVKLDCGYRIDLLVEHHIIIEIKAVEKLLPIHTAQILTYLKLSGNRIGLLINFNEYRLSNGIKRIVNGY